MKRGIEILSVFFSDRRKKYSAVILFLCLLPHSGTFHPKLHIPIGSNLKEQSWFKFSLKFDLYSILVYRNGLLLEKAKPLILSIYANSSNYSYLVVRIGS